VKACISARLAVKLFTVMALASLIILAVIVCAAHIALAYMFRDISASLAFQRFAFFTRTDLFVLAIIIDIAFYSLTDMFLRTEPVSAAVRV